MEYISEFQNALKNLISENNGQILKNPIAWILLVLMFAGVYALFDVPEKTRQNSFGNVLRQLMQLVMDVSSELLDLLRSLMGFISVLEMLLFGKLNRKTLYILTNFAIVYLSAASFITTLTGLTDVAGPVVAVFISFGMQVSILICSIELQKVVQKIFHTKGEKKNSRRIYQYSFDENVLDKIRYLEKKYSKNGNEQERTQENSYKEKGGLKILKAFFIGILLLVSVSFSSFFSYLFMFEKFVEKNLVYDDHFRVITVSHTIIVDYTQELNSYRVKIAEILEQYNDMVEEKLQLRMDNPLRRAEQHVEKIQGLEDQAKKLDEEIGVARQNVEAAEAGTEEYFSANNTLDRLMGDWDKIESEIETENTEYNDDLIFQNRLQAYESIMDLSVFYANAAYLQAGDEERFRQAFIRLQQAEAALENEEQYSAGFTEQLSQADRNELTNAFETYMALGRYFTIQESLQIDFSKVQEAMDFTYGDAISDEDDGEKAYIGLSEQEYMEKSNNILIAMLNTINELPVLGSINNIWTDKEILPPNQTDYLEKIYDLYRDNNGTVTKFERAGSKLFGKNGEKTGLVWILLLMALTVDGTSVWLIFLRGRGRNYNTRASELRQLLGILFVDDSEGKETIRIHKEQSFCATMGVATGVMGYILYRIKVTLPENGISTQEDIFYFAFFNIIGLILGLVAHRFYRMVLRQTKKWEDEELYIKMKEIWLDDTREAQEWDEKIDMMKKGDMRGALTLSEEAEKRLRAMWGNEHEKRTFQKYFSDSVNELFEKIQEMVCYKYVITVKIRKGKVRKTVDDKIEKVILPCLKETYVEKYGLKKEFSVLQSKYIVGFDIAYNENGKTQEEGFYILTEKFWNLLYDTILLKLVGSRVSKLDIEEALYDDLEDEED